MRDMLSNTQRVRSASLTLSGVTPGVTSAFDRRGFDAMSVYLETGTVTDAGTAAGFTMKLQHSNTLVGTDFVDCAETDVIGGPTVTVTLDADDDKTIGGVGYIGGLRYVRAVFTGTTGTAAVAYASASLGRPHRAPCTSVGAAVATT